MVGAHLPQRAGALHALIANQGVHEGLIKGVAHVQRASDVRRRNQDAVTLATVIRFEKGLFLPVRVKALFDGLGIKVVVHGDSDSA